MSLYLMYVVLTSQFGLGTGSELSVGSFLNIITKGLASLWKRLLEMSDEELGIDAEYTKPALEEFLLQFKKEVELIETCHGAMKFKYKQSRVEK